MKLRTVFENMISRILTNYEQGEYEKVEYVLEDMYELLVRIQNNWECLLADDDITQATMEYLGW